jgi:hypothetical protein
MKDKKVSNTLFKPKRVAGSGGQSGTIQELMDRSYVENIAALKKFITKNKSAYVRYDQKQDGLNIGRFLLRIKNLYKLNKISESKKTELLEIDPNILLDNGTMKWNCMYDRAKKFYDENGNTTVDNQDYENRDLKYWIWRQTKEYTKHALGQKVLVGKSLELWNDRQNKLNSIGFQVDARQLIDRNIRKDLQQARRFQDNKDLKNTTKKTSVEFDERNQASLLKAIDSQIEILRLNHNIKYIDILRKRHEEKVENNKRECEQLAMTTAYYNDIDEGELE